MKKENQSLHQTQEIPFYKLHAAGNDCIIFESQALPASQHEQFVRAIADRHCGIGADQVLELLQKSPLAFQVWNCNGTKAEMCGNGTRAMVALALHKNWLAAGNREIQLMISGKAYRAIVKDEKIELCLGILPAPSYEKLSIGKQNIVFWRANVGNPHAVIFLGNREGEWDAPEDFNYQSIGARIEHHSAFPQGTNVEFVEAEKDKRKGAAPLLKVRVWERGAGATRSSGSGAVAAALAYRALAKQELAAVFRISMSDFQLSVRFVGGEVFLGGPTSFIASGTYHFNLA